MAEQLASPSDCGCNACIPITLNAGTVNQVTNTYNITQNPTGQLSPIILRASDVLPAAGAFDGQEYIVEATSEWGYWDASQQVWVKMTV